jgi:hypothetical protein
MDKIQYALLLNASFKYETSLTLPNTPIERVLNDVDFENMPNDIKKYKIFRNIVSNNGMALQCVPENMRNHDICKIAVTNNGMALQYVPENMRNHDICKIAVTNNGMALQYLIVQSYENCRIAVSNNGFAIMHVYMNLLTDELCEIAVNQNPFAITCIQPSMRTPVIYNTAVKKNGYVLSVIKIYCDNLDLYYDLCNIGLTVSPFIYNGQVIHSIQKKADYIGLDLDVLVSHNEHSIDMFNKKK